MKKIFGTLCILGFSVFSFSQTSTLNPTIDAFVDNQSPTINFGGSSYTYLEVGVKILAKTTTVRRSLIQFDLSSIPQNAVITSASLIFTKVSEGTDATNSSYSLQRLDPVTTQWVETSVNWNNQPASITSDAVNASTSNSTERIFDVKDHVSKMVSGMYANRGWVLKRANETVATLGSTYKSRHTTPQPRLVVNYYIPYNVSNVVFNHASSTSATNGSINVTLANGSTSTPTYKWYTSGTTLISGATTNQLSNVGYGWYGLKVIGSQGDTSSFAFILGVNCQNVSINFNPGPDYVDDAVVSDANINTNSGNGNVISASHFLVTPNYYNFRSLLKFRFWLDPTMTFNQANMLLTGNGHNTASRTNASQLDAVSTAWTEKSVCWYNQPTSVTSTQVLIPTTTTANENKTLNMIPFMNLWKNSNSTNYGALFKLQSSADPAATMSFNSSDATTTSLRPTIALNVFINNAVAGTVSTSNASICNGSTTSLNLTGYSTGASLQWQKSTNGTSYTNISGATSSTYVTLASTNVDTYYRCVVTVGTCSSLNTNAVLITIKPVPTLTVNNAIFCTGDNVSLTANPSIAGGTYLWSTAETTNSIQVAPSSNQNYTVNYTLNGCVSNTAQSMVTVCGVSVIYNDSLEKGNISINVDNAPNKIGPYHFNISNSPIENLSSIYHFLNDSLYQGAIDSASFFTGDFNSTNYTFENLQMGAYFVSVFDSRGYRIFDKEIPLFPSFNLSDKNGVNIVGNIISSVTSNASSMIDVYYFPDNNLKEMQYTIKTLNKDHFFGFVNSTETNSVEIQNYKYGFSVKNGKLRLIENGIEGTTEYVINVGNKLKIRFIDSDVIYFLDNQELRNTTVSGVNCFKNAFCAALPSVFLEFKPYNLVKKKHYFTVTGINNYNCFSQSAKFNFKATNFLNTPFNYSWQLFKDGTLVLSGNSIGGTVNTIDPLISGAGKYELIGLTSFGASFSTNFYIGYETTWTDLSCYNFGSNSFSLNKSTACSSAFSYGRAENILPSTENGWLIFNPALTNISFQSLNYLRFSQNNIAGTTPLTNEVWNVRTFKTLTGYKLGWWYNNLGSTSVSIGTADLSANAQIKIKFESNLIKIYINEILKATIPRPSTSVILRANSRIANEGFKDVIASWDCSPEQSLSTIDYHELKRNIDGGFALALEGKLKFSYDEEYFLDPNTKYVPVVIYDDENQLLESSDMNGNQLNNSLNINDLTVKFDDNRITLDISNVNGVVLGDYYILEVENSKGDKRRIRFLYKN